MFCRLLGRQVYINPILFVRLGEPPLLGRQRLYGLRLVDVRLEHKAGLAGPLRPRGSGTPVLLWRLITMLFFFALYSYLHV